MKIIITCEEFLVLVERLLKIHQFAVSRKNMPVNATEPAKACDKQVNEFMSNEQAKYFIKSCLNNGKSRFLVSKRRKTQLFHDNAAEHGCTGFWL
jgi:hypothetical protein